MSEGSASNLDPDRFPAVLDGMPVGITVVDLQGTLLYYNAHAARIIDRKPEYLGTDIRQCHQNPETIAKIDSLLKEFAAGERSGFSYRVHRYGRHIEVVFTPLLTDGRLTGVIQTVMEVMA